MGWTIWYFGRPKPGLIVPLTRSRMSAFFDGRGRSPLPPDEGGYVYWVEQPACLENRVPQGLAQRGFHKSRVLESGLVDEAHRSEVTSAMIGSIDWGISALDRAEATNVIEASRKFEGRRADWMGRWEPTTAEVEQLRAAINKKAGRVLV